MCLAERRVHSLDEERTVTANLREKTCRVYRRRKEFSGTFTISPIAQRVERTEYKEKFGIAKTFGVIRNCLKKTESRKNIVIEGRVCFFAGNKPPQEACLRRRDAPLARASPDSRM